MKKWTYHHVYIILLSLCLLSGMLHGILMSCGIHMILGSYSSTELQYFSGCVFVVLLLIWGLHYLCNQNNSDGWDTSLKTFLCILIIVFLLIAFSNYVFNINASYTTFQDESHSVVVSYQTFFTKGGGIVYEKTTSITMKKIGSYGLDDSYSPKHFRCTWYDTYVEINFGPMSKTFEYLK